MRARDQTKSQYECNVEECKDLPQSFVSADVSRKMSTTILDTSQSNVYSVDDQRKFMTATQLSTSGSERRSSDGSEHGFVAPPSKHSASWSFAPGAIYRR